MTAGPVAWWRHGRRTTEPLPAAADPARRPDDGELRRWPWALLAAVLGAVAGGVVALLVRRQLQADPPNAQEPHELRAVVDRPGPHPSR
jgi:hypothetical protein